MSRQLIPPLEEDLQNAIMAFIPELPMTQEQKLYLRRLVNSLAEWPEDWNTAKDLQHQGQPIDPEANAELAAGMWVNKIRPALERAFREVFVGPNAPHKGTRGIWEKRDPLPKENDN